MKSYTVINRMTEEEKMSFIEDFEQKGPGSKADHVKTLEKKYDTKWRALYQRYSKLKDMMNNDTSTLYDGDGNVKLQWIKKKNGKEEQILAYRKAVDKISKSMKISGSNIKDVSCDDGDLTLYVCNDVHLGGLAFTDETRDRDWNEDIAVRTVRKAVDALVDRAPATKECVVVDLGDLLEMDNSTNMTRRSKNLLDVSTRYPYALRMAMELMVYMVDRALEKHEKVWFYNVAGNHDNDSSYAINAFVTAWYKKVDRVVVDDSVSAMKYHKHGSTLLGFAHGEDTKMADMGEIMAMHNEEVWSDTKDRYFHCGHSHRDAVVDGRLCRVESHRNMAPINAWAARKGMGRNSGTMKAVVYSPEWGEETRITYNVRREDGRDS